MEPRVLASLVSSLVSQALLLLLLLLSIPLSSSPPPIPLIFSSHHPLLPPLLLHLLSSSQTAAAAAALLPRKRKRPPFHSEAAAAAAAAVPRGNPDHFRQCFNMSAATFEWLSGLLDPLLDCGGPLAGPAAIRLPGPARLAVGLSRLATGAAYADLAARFGVPEPAARFCARRLCRVLCTNFRFWLAFPSPPDLPLLAASFRSLSGGVPGCCGALARARVGDVAVQVVADASSRILSIAAGFRADSSDYRVLRCSSLHKDMEDGKLLGASQYLVGNGSYPLLPWLMVPFKDPEPRSFEEDFNAVHRMMCRPVLRTVASLKNWGVVNRLMEEDAKTAVACIGTCAILHNVLLMREDYTALVDVGGEDLEVFEPRAEAGDLEDFVAEDKALVLRSTLAAQGKAIRGTGCLVLR